MSPRPRQPVFRTARAVVFATVCVTLATLGHDLASHDPVPGWAVLAGFGAVLAVTLALAGHERSLPTIMGGLLGGQFALHTLFASATEGMRDCDTTAHAEHAAATPAMHGSGTSMTLAHVAAAIAAAWWLRRGERAAWSLARRLASAADRPIRLLLALLLIEPAERPARTPVVPVAAGALDTGRALRHQVVRRGPPPRSRALARL
ncbi:hypothetical protein [Actinomadura montaniterrae]|uniref:Uncharacterized protein n=1 Tax=Actinomadura montaniterrae TaxID=1803903 RepID=A0A6L3VY00_9ACTN|nr:hypothetical protein [Actinomadura montaniterrae]KAB2382706.1 hypothetical protein F9B16_13995 [Actinomadura montaniterrae]